MISNQYISKLELRNKELNVIPKEVFGLKNLRKLDLRNNRLKVIPKEIIRLQRLEVLDISYNNLEFLHAGLFNLKNLKILLISHNQLKQIPKQIGNLSRLRILNLSNNSLKELPPELSKLQEIREINLSKNRFENFPVPVLKLANLNTLWLNNNSLLNFPTNDILENLRNLKKIYCFGFSNIVDSDYNSHYIKLSKIKGNSIKALRSYGKNKRLKKSKTTMRHGNPTTKTNIFISYSHQDIDWLKKIQTYLKVLNFENEKLEVWDDTKIKPGNNWKEEIKKALESCRIAILLISMDFLASDFIRNDELPPLLKQAQSENTIILPLIVRPSRFTKDKNLSGFQSINDPNKPLSKLGTNEQEELLVKLTDTVESYL